MNISDLNYSELIVADVNGGAIVSGSSSGHEVNAENQVESKSVFTTTEHGRTTTTASTDFAQRNVRNTGGAREDSFLQSFFKH